MSRTLSFFLLLSVFMATSSSDQAAAEAFSSPDMAGELPQLPPPDPNSNLPTIRLGETIRFEEMGPIILNTDGTTRRIENWDTLTEKEKEVTWRRISKRNEERRQILLRQQEEMMRQQEQQQKQEGSAETNEASDL